MVSDFLRWARPMLVAVTLAFAAQAGAQIVVMDKVIAVVDGDVILASEYVDRLAAIRRNAEQQGMQLPPDDELQDEVLERLILERIQLQRGERAGVRFSDAEINEAMGSLAAQNGMNLEQFRQQLEAEGDSYAAAREQVMHEMIVNAVQSGSLRSRIQISEQDVDNFLRSQEGQERTAASYRALHLLLPLASDASEAEETAAQEYLEELRGGIVDGNAFEALTAAPPQQPYPLTAGDLGWRSASNLPSIFAEVVPQLAENEVSKPIRSASGYHLVKLMAKRGGEGQVIKQTAVRHILVKPSEIRTVQQTRELISSLRERLLDGEDFNVLAREFSEDPGSAMEGGDLGWVSPGQMVPEFHQAMEATATDEISQPFETQFGWHILQVTERRDQDVSAEMRRNQARNILYRERFEEELALWLREIRDQAFVEIKI